MRRCALSTRMRVSARAGAGVTTGRRSGDEEKEDEKDEEGARSRSREGEEGEEGREEGREGREEGEGGRTYRARRPSEAHLSHGRSSAVNALQPSCTPAYTIRPFIRAYMSIDVYRTYLARSTTCRRC